VDVESTIPECMLQSDGYDASLTLKTSPGCVRLSKVLWLITLFADATLDDDDDDDCNSDDDNDGVVVCFVVGVDADDAVAVAVLPIAAVVAMVAVAVAVVTVKLLSRHGKGVLCMDELGADVPHTAPDASDSKITVYSGQLLCDCINCQLPSELLECRAPTSPSPLRNVRCPKLASEPDSEKPELQVTHTVCSAAVRATCAVLGLLLIQEDMDCLERGRGCVNNICIIS